MKNQQLASDDAHPSSANPQESQSFDTLSRILVALMCAAVAFFAILLVQVELAPVVEELLAWVVASLAAGLAFIVVIGFLEQRAD